MVAELNDSGFLSIKHKHSRIYKMKKTQKFDFDEVVSRDGPSDI